MTIDIGSSRTRIEKVAIRTKGMQWGPGMKAEIERTKKESQKTAADTPPKKGTNEKIELPKTKKTNPSRESTRWRSCLAKRQWSWMARLISSGMSSRTKFSRTTSMHENRGD